MRETELKCIISEDVYNIVKAAFAWDCAATQVNYYYSDANGELKKRGVTARVRVRDGISRLQIKKRQNADGALQISEETEFEIDGAQKIIPAAKASEVLGFDAGDLTLLGSASTLRSSLMWDETTEICLDKTEYLGVTDYEVEIEYSGELKKELTDKFSELGVEFNKNSTGKFTRFIRKLNELK